MTNRPQLQRACQPPQTHSLTQFALCDLSGRRRGRRNSVCRAADARFSSRSAWGLPEYVCVPCCFTVPLNGVFSLTQRYSVLTLVLMRLCLSSVLSSESLWWTLKYTTFREKNWQVVVGDKRRFFFVSFHRWHFHSYRSVQPHPLRTKHPFSGTGTRLQERLLYPPGCSRTICSWDLGGPPNSSFNYFHLSPSDTPSPSLTSLILNVTLCTHSPAGLLLRSL